MKSLVVHGFFYHRQNGRRPQILAQYTSIQNCFSIFAIIDVENDIQKRLIDVLKMKLE